MKFTDVLKSVPKEKALKRLLYCAAMLHIHGFLTDAERRKVHSRMMKQRKKEERQKP